MRRKPGTYERVGSRITEDESWRIEQIRKGFEVLDEALDAALPNGRYKSIVKTNLETAQMFATKAVTHDIEREMGDD